MQNGNQKTDNRRIYRTIILESADARRGRSISPGRGFRNRSGTDGSKSDRREEEIYGRGARDKGTVTKRQRFLRLAEEDARVFEPLAACYRLPSETEEEKAYKEQAMEQHLLAASSVPAEMMKEALRMLEILEFLGEKGSRMAASDVGVGVQLIRAPEQ